MVDPRDHLEITLLRREIDRLLEAGELDPMVHGQLSAHLDRAADRLLDDLGDEERRELLRDALLDLRGSLEACSPMDLAALLDRYDDEETVHRVEDGAIVRVRPVEPPPEEVPARREAAAPEAGREVEPVPPERAEEPGETPAPERGPEPSEPWRPSRETVFIGLQIAGAVLTIAGSLPLAISDWSSAALKALWFCLCGGVFYGVGVWADLQLGRREGRPHLVTRVWLTIFCVLVPLILVVVDTIGAPGWVRGAALVPIGAALADASRRLAGVDRVPVLPVGALIGLAGLHLLVTGAGEGAGLHLLWVAGSGLLAAGFLGGFGPRESARRTPATLAVVLAFADGILLARVIGAGAPLAVLSPGLMAGALVIEPLALHLVARAPVRRATRHSLAAVLRQGALVLGGIALLAGLGDEGLLLVAAGAGAVVSGARAVRETSRRQARLGLGLGTVAAIVLVGGATTGWQASFLDLLGRPELLGRVLLVPSLLLGAVGVAAGRRGLGRDAATGAAGLAVLVLVVLVVDPPFLAASLLALGGTAGLLAPRIRLEIAAWVAASLAGLALLAGPPGLPRGLEVRALLLGGLAVLHAGIVEVARRQASRVVRGLVVRPHRLVGAATALLVLPVLLAEGGPVGPELVAGVGLACIALLPWRGEGVTGTLLVLTHGVLALLAGWILLVGWAPTATWLALAGRPGLLAAAAAGILGLLHVGPRDADELAGFSREGLAVGGIALVVLAAGAGTVAGLTVRTTVACGLLSVGLGLEATRRDLALATGGAAVAAVAGCLVGRAVILGAPGLPAEVVLDGRAGAVLALVLVGTAHLLRRTWPERAEVLAHPVVDVALGMALVWAGLIPVLARGNPGDPAVWAGAGFTATLVAALPLRRHRAVTYGACVWLTGTALLFHELHVSGTGAAILPWWPASAAVVGHPASPFLGTSLVLASCAYLADGLAFLRELRRELSHPLAWSAAFLGLVVLGFLPGAFDDPLIFGALGLGLALAVAIVSRVFDLAAILHESAFLAAAAVLRGTAGLPLPWTALEVATLAAPLLGAAYGLAGRFLERGPALAPPGDDAGEGDEERPYRAGAASVLAGWAALLVGLPALALASTVLGTGPGPWDAVPGLVAATAALGVAAILTTRSDPAAGAALAGLAGFALAARLGPELPGGRPALPLVAWAAAGLLFHRLHPRLLGLLPGDLRPRARSTWAPVSSAVVQVSALAALAWSVAPPASWAGAVAGGGTAAVLHELFRSTSRETGWLLGLAGLALHAGLGVAAVRLVPGSAVLALIVGATLLAWLAWAGRPALEARPGASERLLGRFEPTVLDGVGLVDAAVAAVLAGTRAVTLSPEGMATGRGLIGVGAVASLAVLGMAHALRRRDETLVWGGLVVAGLAGFFAHEALPWLFELGIVREYWPLLLIPVTWALAAGRAPCRRAPWTVLRRPFGQAALGLLAPAFLGSTTLAAGPAALVWFGGAGLLWVLHVQEEDGRYLLGAILAANVGVFPLLGWFDLGVLRHAEVYLAPAGLTLMLAARDPRVGSAEHRELLRTTGALLVLGSFGWVILVDDHLRILESLALGGVSAGLVATGTRWRIRSLLGLGLLGAILDLLNLCHLVLAEGWISLGLLLVLVGFATVAVSSVLYARWERIQGFIDQVKEWEEGEGEEESRGSRR